MFKKILFVVLVFASSIQARQNWGNTGIYSSIHGGATFLDIDDSIATICFQPGFFVGGAVGYKCAETGLRPELEITYRQNDIKNVTIDSFVFNVHGYIGNLSYMGNLYIDVNMCSDLTLYVGGGAGYSQNWGKASYSLGDGDTLGISEHIKSNGPAYQVIVGFDYTLCKKIDLGVAYRFFQAHRHGKEHDIGFSIKRYF